jgi:hypothetical protein
MCGLVCFLEYKTIISLNMVKQVAFVLQMHCILFEGGTNLYKYYINELRASDGY